ncbi:prepilin-type N-terminal cleavage/methylation domain-containing protein [Alteromonas sp. ASW11-19]|uniref:Prepilin-type N-terminal cleavage/methylation domain-containing protein n=1 Tax=Alteromonas salexigens TaxID=2982530 RepID=A0ABT2VN65_9ALTE|nr:prepilin-type N-terminal cleavage/methylation domain-containing protein [Alteromonas salexigens]MCU7554689.1 prepilin-type N-terminal cleavage/methylation domain-containing protein [Alteromonas salexigens]
MKPATGLSHQCKFSQQVGFTLIELVVTLLVIAVIAVTAAARFQDNTGYTEYTLQQRLISSLRHMQYRAMQDDRAGFCYQLVFQNGSSPAFGPSTSNYSAGQESSSCSLSIALRAPDYLQANSAEISGESVTMATREGRGQITFMGFTNLGRPLTNNFNCLSGCEVTFTGADTASVCVEREGFIYAC